jgi:hypothetical protein
LTGGSVCREPSLVTEDEVRDIIPQFVTQPMRNVLDV